jgi:hypothetical protein
MVLGWAFGFDHEGRDLMNGISAFIKETPESCLDPLFHLSIHRESGPQQTLNMPVL